MSVKDQRNTTKHPVTPAVIKTLDHTHHGSRPKMRILQFYLMQDMDSKLARLSCSKNPKAR